MTQRTKNFIEVYLKKKSIKKSQNIFFFFSAHKEEESSQNRWYFLFENTFYSFMFLQQNIIKKGFA
jgi:hypothetical protein